MAGTVPVTARGRPFRIVERRRPEPRPRADAAGGRVRPGRIRISGYVSFTGEKRPLTESDLRTLAAKLVRQALRTGGERPVAADEQQAVADALATTLHALGDLTLTDLDAVRPGAANFAGGLRRAAGRPERHLSADATHFYRRRPARRAARPPGGPCGDGLRPHPRRRCPAAARAPGLRPPGTRSGPA
ncbi:hypothetical protein [Streptomyces sp. NPDC101206]|uniref:NACHT N-terminal Helical domain 1-containing protein n=1 Tax=Streptomyces sp. NPDC101206 TaxID=3366128 RepID=UPI003811CC48